MGETPFRVPLDVAALMRGFDPPWFVAGGWAIDLFLGRVTRDHQDIEIAILRRDQQRIRGHLRGWEFQKVLPGSHGVLEPWREGGWIELPVHEIHARRDDAHPSTLEILLNESSGTDWQFRRNTRVTRPLSQIGSRSDEGIPFLAPEIVLLYKAKGTRAIDEGDFEGVLTLLGDEPRHWLRAALLVCHPEHPWLTALSIVAAGS